MRVVDYFAGLGGFTLGASMAGASVVAAVNHWRLAVDTHARNHPGVRHECEDLTRFNPSRLPDFDVLVASPACQGHARARVVASNGYVLVRVGKGHHLADVRGYAYEHRLVAEEKLGRRLRDGEQVHHIDGDKANNDPRNLDVVTFAEHRVEHRHSGSVLRMPGEANPAVACACGCGQTFERYDRFGRPRRFLSGHNTAARNSRGRAA